MFKFHFWPHEDCKDLSLLLFAIFFPYLTDSNASKSDSEIRSIFFQLRFGTQLQAEVMQLLKTETETFTNLNWEVECGANIFKIIHSGRNVMTRVYFIEVDVGKPS